MVKIERKAALTLAGERLIRVAQLTDPDSGAPQQFRFTLTTRPSETPKPAETYAAAAKWLPAGALLTHTLAEKLPGEAANPVALRLERGVDKAFMIPSHHAAAARQEVEEAIVAGLRAREGFCLELPVLLPGAPIDRLLYSLVQLVWASLYFLENGTHASSRPWAADITTCKSCSVVFRPRRAKTMHCDLCRKRDAPPQLRLPRKGAGMTTGRRGRLLEGTRTVVTGWERISVGSCPDCGDLFSARKDASACPSCAPAAAARRHRAAPSSRLSHGTIVGQ